MPCYQQSLDEVGVLYGGRLAIVGQKDGAILAVGSDVQDAGMAFVTQSGNSVISIIVRSVMRKRGSTLFRMMASSLAKSLRPGHGSPVQARTPWVRSVWLVAAAGAHTSGRVSGRSRRGSFWAC